MNITDNSRKTKVLLIQPSQIDDDGSIRKNTKGLFPRLALPQLAAITPNEFETSIIDEFIEDINFDADIDLVGISTTTAQVPRAYQIAEEFRKRGKKVIFGGMHPSLLPDEVQLYADSILIGEAEYLWKEVLSDFNQGILKPRYENTTSIDLTNIPSPNLNKLSLDKYAVLFKPIQTTRGCPYNCDYCSVTNFFGKTYRHRSIDDVVREVEALDSKYIFFVDDNIAANPKRAKQLFKALTPLKIKWTSQCCMSIIYDDEMLELARDSGCINLMMGLESLSPQSLETVNKKSINKVDDYFYMVDKLHKYGITLMAFMIFGFDFDDETVFDKTCKFAEDAKIDFPCFWILTPYPNTPLFDRMESEGRIIQRDWSKYDCNHVVFQPKLMSPKTLQDGYNYACKRVYSIPSIMKRFILPSSFIPTFNRAKSLLGIMPPLLTQLKLFREGSIRKCFLAAKYSSHLN
ncbi:MAG: hypothetical protein A2104_06570 [Candidatus Melainabacteria bacterium GWF2_32_7]|nr:MAG: hypothetical protein A2104_06570 [Candidatus Melainabacteria bacterium GWF2_32_7]